MGAQRSYTWPVQGDLYSPWRSSSPSGRPSFQAPLVGPPEEPLGGGRLGSMPLLSFFAIFSRRFCARTMGAGFPPDDLAALRPVVRRRRCARPRPTIMQTGSAVAMAPTQLGSHPPSPAAPFARKTADLPLGALRRGGGRDPLGALATGEHPAEAHQATAGLDMAPRAS
mmetsp:Transcript_67710/g.177570  ORF Transcript_67710/g.177570 Transcript_67710/m.177570 type:complete len:169 (-) Transcript_67710:20-526(-)